MSGRWRGRSARDLDEELRFHLDMRTEDLVAEGWDPDAARVEALRQFGSVGEVHRACRRTVTNREGDLEMANVAHAFRQDIRFAVRQLLRGRGTSALALLTIALGIAATTVVFSVVNAVVLRPLPFERPEELVALRSVSPQGTLFSVSESNYLDWRARSRVFEEMAIYGRADRTWSRPEGSVVVAGMAVTHTLFPLLGIEPTLGRSFTGAEDTYGGPERVAVLAETFWRGRFGADASVVGAVLRLDGEPYEVVGVVPTERAFPGVEIFTPHAPDPSFERSNALNDAVARLAPGTTIDDARRDIARVSAELAAEYPVENGGWSATAVGLHEYRVGPRLTRLGLFLAGAVALLLLMACVSVSNLLVARATVRAREMAVRAALGAGRLRIVSQLLTESALLGVLGGTLGVAVAWWVTPLVRALGPADAGRMAEASIDGTVLLVALGASLASILFFGAFPSFQLGRGRLFDALAEGGRTASGSGRRVRDGLVVAQFAVAVVVVLGAGLMLRSFVELQRADLGMVRKGVLSFGVSLPDTRFQRRERVAFLDELEREIAALPGVTAVGTNMAGPFGPFRPANRVASADEEPDRREDFQQVSWRAVTTGYFEAAGIHRIAGRLFDERDVPPADEAAADAFQLPVVLDSLLAQALWPGRPPAEAVGEQVVWFGPGGTHMLVIGVAETVRDESFEADPRRRIYLPYWWSAWQRPTVLVRTAGDPGILVTPVREVLRRIDPEVPMIAPGPLEEVLAEAIAWPRFTMQVLAAFAVLAVLLAGMGVYGITAFAVERRRREIGVRVALGARPGRVLVEALTGAGRLVALGIAVGTAVSVGLAGTLRSLLFDVAPRDPLTFTLVPLGLAALALLAAWMPARRATRVDPREALAAD